MFDEILRKFLSGQNLSEKEEILLIREIKIIIRYALKSTPIEGARRIYSQEFLKEELLSDTILKLIDKKEIILTKMEKSNYVKSYVKLIIANDLKDKIKKKTISVKDNQEDEFQHISTSIKPIIKMEAMEFIKISKESLTDKEKEAICLELIETKQKGYAIEKAKSRAKNRLRTIAQTNEFSFDAVNFALNRLFLSEICQEFVSIE